MPEKDNRPFVCKRLGVEVDEPFTIKDRNGIGPDCIYRILPSGCYITAPENRSGSSVWMMRAIQDPSIVYAIGEERYELTEGEQEFVDALFLDFPYAVIYRNGDFPSRWKSCYDTGYTNFLPNAMFRSIPPDGSIKVSEYTTHKGENTP